ncbi:MAG: alanine--tRNA ligase [Clostridia bacterium]|nr:alanine--tRNA ligase [Clostridia bacterium]
MEYMGLNEIRERFLSFFEGKGHLRLKSFPLVPINDNSLLLINAGMAPLKPYFTGKEVPPRERVTTCQKCIRTPDIERVGKTARHGTFFEMLGNFSFGDYFKKEVIPWAWEFITEDLKIDKDRLWVTIYEDDDEAEEIWSKIVPKDRIVRMGKEDNFWEIGTGPCGPCSEIYYDRGPEAGCGSSDCHVGCDCDRFVEFWNLVFTQFDKDENGNYNRLAHPNIDTGMGLERIAAIMQGVSNLFEVDTIKNIMTAISKRAGVEYGKDPKTDVSLRVVTDHIRSTVFLISDNVSPSNEGRGYVLRRLLRRGARHGRLLGIKGAFLSDIADVVIHESASAYPELEQKKDYIKKIIEIEEKRFEETIDTGLSLVSELIADLEKNGEKTMSAEDAFRLYDTYGFPLDLTIEILAEKGLGVDEKGFAEEMQIQRERARAARGDMENAGWSVEAFDALDKNIKTEFDGYTEVKGKGKVIALTVNGEFAKEASDGADAAVLLDRTVFYGESGGQAGDTGVMYADGFKAEVYDTKKRPDGKIIHFVNITEGTLFEGAEVSLEIDCARRAATARNHSATHLLQQALTDVLGSHISQAGSSVNNERLRFDFNHFEALSFEEMTKVQRIVNEKILAAMPVSKTEMSIEDAEKTGARALFGEKYGKTVRVIDMGGYSIELCGGTHIDNTSEIGFCKIISESGVAAGVRRIEAITGEGVLKMLEELDNKVNSVAQVLKTTPSDVLEKLNAFIAQHKEMQKDFSALRAKMAGGMMDNVMTNIRTVGDVKIVCAGLEGLDINELRSMGDKVKDKFPCSLAVLASVLDGKITFVAMATKDAVSKGVHAGNILKEVAKICGGGGGGRPDNAQAGGKDIAKLDNALAIVDELVAGQLK